MAEIRSKYYRVSVKALVLNDSRDKFLVIKQENGVWDLPGGGLEWAEKPHNGLKREILEEMNLQTIKIAEQPSYFLGGYPMSKENDIWIVNVVYETELEHFNFTPSDECVEIKFISMEDVEKLENVPSPVIDLARQFIPEAH